MEAESRVIEALSNLSLESRRSLSEAQLRPYGLPCVKEIV
jgi:hypothetical protein